MSAAHAIDVYRTCSACGVEQPKGNFRTKSRQCRACVMVYARMRNTMIRGDMWNPNPGCDGKWRRSKELAPDRSLVVSGQYEAGTAEALEASMLAFMLAHGFSALLAASTRLQASLAKQHREELAEQGWIA